MTRWNPLLNPGAVFVNGKEQESPANACMSLSRCWEEGRRVREKEEGGRNVSGLCLQLPSPQAGMKFPKHNDFAALCSSCTARVTLALTLP